jgi:signal transduction histidine kinase
MMQLFGYETFIVKNDLQNFNSAPYTFYIQDSNNSFTAEDILNAKDLKKLQTDGQIGNRIGPFWTRIELKNNTSHPYSLMLYNILPGTNSINVYIYKGDTLIKTHLLGDMYEASTKDIKSRYSTFELNLKPQESYTIVSKVYNYTITNLTWYVSDKETFYNEESNILLKYGLFGGFMLLFSMISIALVFVYKKNAYLIIGLHTLSLFFYTYCLQGIFQILEMEINLNFISLYAWIAPNIHNILMLLFALSYFDMKNKYKKFYLSAQILILFNIIILFMTAYGIEIDAAFTKFAFLIGIAVVLTTFFIIFSGIYMKEIGSKFYLLGQIISGIAVFFHILSIFGFIDYHEYYRLIPIGGNVVDIILLLVAQTLKTKHQIDLLNSRKLALVEHSRFSAMGYAINNITHQWKHPLTHLGSSIALIEAIAKNKKESIVEYLNQELPKISYSINLMKNTLDEFSNYYTKDMKKENFSPKDSINHIIHILNSKIVLKNTSISLNIENDLKIYNYEHVFSNIMIILIDNSLDAFETTSKNNQITISITSDTDAIYLVLEDNAGGIKVKPIEKVFELNISTKDNEKNKGIGLSLVKMLVEERFDGNINVSNTDDGAIFKIKIKKTNTKES